MFTSVLGLFTSTRGPSRLAARLAMAPAGVEELLYYVTFRVGCVHQFVLAPPISTNITDKAALEYITWSIKSKVCLTNKCLSVFIMTIISFYTSAQFSRVDFPWYEY